MSLAGNAIIAIWNDITNELRDSFFEWHPREHMNERLALPGFLRGSRYIAVDADIEFFTLYEATDTSAFSSPEYMERLGEPTPWSLQVLPGFRNNLRGVCDVTYSQSVADGGALMTIRLEASSSCSQELQESLHAKLLPPILDRPKITGVHLAICNKSLSGTNTALQRGRTINTPNWIVMIEGSDEQALKNIDGLSDQTLRNSGAASDIVRGTYRFEYSVSKLPPLSVTKLT